VEHPPKDLEIRLEENGGFLEADVIDKGFEKYYTFYSRELKVYGNRLQVATAGKTTLLDVSGPLKKYENIFTLDTEKMSLIPGKLLSRSIILILLRLVLTILIEAPIFFLFGFTERRSWIVFFIANFVTQGILNVFLNGLSPVTSYLIFPLVFGEIFVFIGELILFNIFTDEQSGARIFSYVVTANAVSLILGSYIIEYLPV